MFYEFWKIINQIAENVILWRLEKFMEKLKSW